MNDYISREAALEKVIEVKHRDPELSGVVWHRYIKESDLKYIPAADVAPVVYGEWEHTHTSAYYYSECWKCSACGFEDTEGYDFNYCPNCGAKMGGK